MKNVIYGIVAALIIIVCFFFQWKWAVAEDVVPMKVVHQTDTQSLIKYYAKRYRVSESQMRNTIKCESGFNTKAVGDGGKSFGLSQIHLPAHPHVTKEQALTPQFAIRFMAEKFSKGQQRLWTCWRNIYG